MTGRKFGPAANSSDGVSTPAAAGAAWQDLLGRLDASGLPYGQERSFKLAPGRVLRDRLLVGIPLRLADAGAPLAIAQELGLPEQGRELLMQALPRASGLLLATEEQGGAVLHKVYLEFWDEVRARVRAGDTTPQLLHLGVKWDRGRPGHYEEARYVCVPLPGTRDVLRRMADAYPGGMAQHTLEIARAIVRQAAMREPRPSLVYLEATEAHNPRRSFDINLYPCGLRVGEVAPLLREAASGFGIDEGELRGPLADLSPLPLGHISGGCDRRGAQFLSVYAEVSPLP